ncbi:bifunctional 4-hydroxy-2-oxoglutarate aldolase/2-dehydro-3-deoxy-phosphogluconate aldolase [Paenibacillus macquariensis]|uniref:2-dehydro-3-deoxyphosphogluconate aldolase / (4S)-4-hydroxy-2-oxoglutarate aldolase n=1 Tax=Paenibacillus macquariensis TaxID=948756 RepID=A0ABY1K2W4_9BACL|nr:bifunctional 4-hydroxy-2-oxoglutarate aldolase/2-dehydro-3-deoxy-phosphogluconate aldolase [Paenibacillus macquariensis]MEC0090269.1 bifunctional 4-hydroxy-2-oxoglutarate aldolase/2-dehydro-3-deoxy-phosphogluconate aldolase [Paenibacillus macquariensis]OAB39630.1 2-dehydro-3-deoxyphosphogluconate aldolase [Paenibacillus macquariensis subsp. macquariensis]SIR18475.1 2-dehydro-3-deoxyphosphogluconate aldolase / (4S)-4-hydroxy-2-oxoglutarate aldolase [Paenibacillus macquariensis]
MDFMESLKETKIIAIVRGIPEDKADAAVEALWEGGVRFLEVTMNTPGALNIIRRWRDRFDGRVNIGAGTVIDADLASAAIKAGAEFLITPNTDEDTIKHAVNAGIPIVPGAMTPTEIVQAWKFGAQAVKVFPSGTLGASYIKELQGPLSHIPMVATGGVTLDNMATYVASGAYAFGLGGSLVNLSWIEAGEYERLKEHAASYVAAARSL